MSDYNISVVIPAYNAAPFIGTQLEALSHQTFDGSFEVIISDNGSSDNLSGAIQPWLKFLDIKIVDASQKKGAAHARNIGALAANSELIAFCDADDIVSPNWLRDHSEVHVKFNNALALGRTQAVEKNENFNPESLHIKEIFSEDLEKFNVFELKENNENLFKAHGLSGNMSIKKSLYVDLGGMDSSFSGASEDNDFTYRHLLNKNPLIYMENGSLAYRQRNTKKGVIKQKFTWGEYDQLLLARFPGYYSPKDMELSNIFYILLRMIPKMILSKNEDDRLERIKKFSYLAGAAKGRIVFKNLGKLPPRDLI